MYCSTLLDVHGDISKVDRPSERVSGRGPAMEVRINKVHAISFWTWSASDEVCAICQNALDACAEGAEYPGDDSSVAWGGCDHAFHLMCLTRWLETNNSCPICRREWSYKSENAADGDSAGAKKESEEANP